MSEPLELLWAHAPQLPPRHRAEAPYGSALMFPGARPRLVANFVQTIDGVIAFGERGGWNASTVSLDSEIDRRVMALLRAEADAIVIGAGTFRTARGHQWSPGGLVPDEAAAFDDLRARVHGATSRAPLYVVSASGDLPADHAAIREPETRVSVVTTATGAARLDGSLPAAVELIAVGTADELDPARVLSLIAERSGGLVLCEGGPRLLGDLTRAGLLDELFLTVAPQLAGRDAEHRRPGLIEGFAAAPDEAPRLPLHSIRRAGDHLFLRYARLP